MKETILDVLMYLFENYINDEIEFDPTEDKLRIELKNAGFRKSEISRAFDWLSGLSSHSELGAHNVACNATSMRLYTEYEIEKIDTECRGFILFLEQTGMLDHHSREIVIDRVMALDFDEIDMEQLKWVILMVLFNQPGSEAAFAWMEDKVFEEESGSCLH
jgi:Smg protein